MASESNGGARPQWSADHKWWWDGQQWIPAGEAPEHAAVIQGAPAPSAAAVLTKRDKKKAQEDKKRSDQEEMRAAERAEEEKRRADLQAKLARKGATREGALPMDKLHGRARKLLVQSLGPSEPVLAQLNGVSDNQALVLTDQRALIIKVGWLTGQTLGGKVTSFDYRNISSVEVRASIMSGTFEIAAGGMQGVERSAWVGGKGGAYEAANVIAIAKRQMPAFQRVANVIRERAREATQTGGQPVAAAAAPDIPDQLRKLAELREQGILTDAEFQAKKIELLARL